MAVSLVAAILAFPVAEAAAQCQPDTSTHTGEGTYYTFADGTGNCLFEASPQDLMLGAMNDPDYGNSEVCGQCVELTGPDGTIRIRIVDRCPECLPGDIDLSPEAFALIAPLSRGRVPISWKLVPCEVTGPIEYHFKDGSNQWWTAVQLRNHRNPVASLEYRTSGGSWKPVNRVNYNYFVESGGMGPGPYAFRVTDIYGHVLQDEGIPHVENGSVAGTGQFPVCEGTASSVGEEDLPASFTLSQNYPNPFNPVTVIRYTLPAAETIRLVLHDALGREIAVLAEGHAHAGVHEAVLEAGSLASGTYYYTLRAGDREATRKLLLVR